jgi:lipopolysaccharide export system permease protein
MGKHYICHASNIRTSRQVIKKLDILIIRAFLGPFVATFIISLFVLIMQFFWLYIDDLVGKGLDLFTLAKLTGLVAIGWIPLALPLALLLSSIMTFGNLGETFEIVAIKSAGISLARFMRPLLIVTIILSGLAFLFSNNIIPVAQLKLASLKYDIIVSKPAFEIKEGVFFDKIEGFVIKIGKKEKNDSIIHNVVIYERNYQLQDNMIVANDGVMRVTPDKKFLEFTLKNGWRYEERGPRISTNTEYIRMGFQEYKKVLDLRSFKMSKTEDSAFRYDPKMLSIRQLNHSIDSLVKGDSVYRKRATADLQPYLSFIRFRDSVWTSADSLKQFKPIGKAGFAGSIPDSFKVRIIERAHSQLVSAQNAVKNLATDYKFKSAGVRLHEIEWHRKFTLSAACIVLFLIGAPLGAIIRKGGLGTPLVFAIIFFVLFHLMNTVGEKIVKESVTAAFAGMWLSTAVLIPIGFFLTFKAMRDSQLFNKEFYYRFFAQLKKIFTNLNKTGKQKPDDYGQPA